MKCKCLGLVALAMIVATGHCLAGDREDLISYLELHASNWASIDRMDVLVRTDESRESAVQPGFTSTTHERIILDWKAKRFTYVRVGSRSTFGSKEKQEFVETGIVIKDGNYRSFLLKNRNKPPMQFASVEQVFDDHHMPDLRISMFMAVSRGSATTWTQHKSDLFQVYPQRAKGIRALGVVDGQVQYELSWPSNSCIRWLFDTEQLMPVQAKMLMDTMNDGNLRVVATEQFSWKNADGVFVPIKIQGDFLDRQNAVSVEELESRASKLFEANPAPNPEAVAKLMKELFVDATHNRDMKLHWLTVNKPLKDDYFDFGLIDNPDQFVLLANPTTVGAPELSNQTNSSH